MNKHTLQAQTAKNNISLVLVMFSVQAGHSQLINRSRDTHILAAMLDSQDG